MATEVQTYHLRIKVGSQGVTEITNLDGKVGRLGHTSERAGRQVSGMRRKVDRLPPSIKTLLVSLTGLLALVAVATATISAGAQAYIGYEREIVNVGSVAGASAHELHRLDQAAREQAKTSVFTARETAQAQYHLASAGLKVNQIIASQRGIMDLAAATQSDLAYTSAAVTSTLSQFNLRAEASTRVGNVFAAAISNSQANMEKLATSMRYVGPIAATLGQDLELTTAQLMALYDGGLQGMQAGTGLRMVMLRLQKPTKEAQEALARLGVTITDDAGRVRPLLEVMADLKAANMSAGDAAGIFGAETVSAAMILAGATEKVGKYTQEITGTNRAQEMARQQMNTMWGDLKKLGSAAEEAAIGFMEKLAPGIRAVVSGLTWVVGNMGKVIVLVLAGAAAWGAYTVAIETAALNLSIWLATLQTLKIALASTVAFLTGPAGIAVALGVGVVALAVLGSQSRVTAQDLKELAEEQKAVSQAWADAETKVGKLEEALDIFDRKITQAGGDQAKEKEAIEELNRLYPVLTGHYNSNAQAIDNVNVRRVGLVTSMQAEAALAEAQNILKTTELFDKARDYLAQSKAPDRRFGSTFRGLSRDVKVVEKDVEGLMKTLVRLGSVASESMYPEETRSRAAELVQQLTAYLERIRDMKRLTPQVKDAIGRMLAAFQQAAESQDVWFNFGKQLEALGKTAQGVAVDIAKIVKPLSKENLQASKIAETLLTGIKKATMSTRAFEQDQLHERYLMYLAYYGHKIPKAIIDGWYKAQKAMLNDKYERQAYKKRYQAAQKYHDEMLGILDDFHKQEAQQEKNRLKSQTDADQKRLAGEKTLRDKMRLMGLQGTELELVRLQQEVEAYEKAGYDKLLVADYIAAQLEEINKSTFQRTLESWMDTNRLIEEGTNNALKNSMRAWTNFFNTLVDGGFNNLGMAFASLGDTILDIWQQMLAQMIAQFTMSGIATLLNWLFFGQGGYMGLNMAGLAVGVGGSTGAGAMNVAGTNPSTGEQYTTTVGGFAAQYAMNKGMNSVWNWGANGGGYTYFAPGLENTPELLASQAGGGSEWAVMNAEIQAAQGAPGWGGTGLSGAGAATTAVGGALTGWQVAQMLYEGKGHSEAGGALGGAGGALLGATFGTAILPGIGTIIGAILGGVAGGVFGGGGGSMLGPPEDVSKEEHFYDLMTGLEGLTEYIDDLTASETRMAAVIDEVNRRQAEAAGLNTAVSRTLGDYKDQTMGVIENTGLWRDANGELIEVFRDLDGNLYDLNGYLVETADGLVHNKEAIGGLSETANEGSAALDNISNWLRVMGESSEGANEILGGYGNTLSDVLNTLADLTPGTKEYADVLANQLNPAYIISTQLQKELAAGADYLEAHTRALDNTILALADSQGISNEHWSQLIDLVISQSGNVADLSAKYERYNEIKKKLMDAHKMERSEVEKLAEELKGLHTELGFEGTSMGALNKVITDLTKAIKSLTGALGGVDGDYTANVTVRTRYHDEYHTGGLVKHAGGPASGGPWVSYEELHRLASGEVMAKLRMGEYVIREEAVNAATMPWLNYVNQTGQPPMMAEPVLMPLTPQAPAPAAPAAARRIVNFEEGSIVVVVQDADDLDELTDQVRDRLLAAEDDAFVSA